MFTFSADLVIISPMKRITPVMVLSGFTGIRWPGILFTVALVAMALPVSTVAIEGFPSERPSDGSYQRPREGEILNISPPGFCWWRAGKRDQVYYVLRIYSSGGREVYTSSRLRDPVHVPETVLQPGAYRWTVDACDSDGKVLDRRTSASFPSAMIILPNHGFQPGTC